MNQLDKLDAGEYLLKNDVGDASLTILSACNANKIVNLPALTKVELNLKDSRLEVEADSDDDMCLKIEENELDDFGEKIENEENNM